MLEGIYLNNFKLISKIYVLPSKTWVKPEFFYKVGLEPYPIRQSELYYESIRRGGLCSGPDAHLSSETWLLKKQVYNKAMENTQKKGYL